MFSRAFAGRAGPAASAACRSCRGSFIMPLRAKIIEPQTGSSAQMSSQAYQEYAPQKGDDPEDVLFNSLYGLRSIELNRPKKLNSLNASMIRKIIPRLMEWEKSDMANVIVMKGAGEKALCAGGDVGALAEANKKGPEGQSWSTEYFALEYQLDHYIATYKKPYIAFMDGITMGGGVGLSVHAPFRIATEKTVFAMPETKIGFFPDVGASFFLPRMAGATGTYLALTSERLTGANVFYSGIATHYLHSTSLPNLESRLAELRFKDFDSIEKRLGVINATIEEYATGLPHDQPILLGGELRKAIDRCFSKDTVAEIIAALKEEDGATKEWAQRTLETLHQRSPTSVHVTLRQMRIGGKWSIKETFVREHQVASHFMQHPDFVEGVTSVLGKSKEPPKWQPATLEDIKESDDVASPFFKRSEIVQPMQTLYNRDYNDYPHAYLGLPTEKTVEAMAREGTYSPRDLVNRLVGQARGKQGVKDVVEEVVERKTEKNAEGIAMWKYD